MRHVPQRRKSKGTYAFTFDYLLVRLREDEIRDQDVKERLHFNQREALAYARLQRNRVCHVLPTATYGGEKCTRGPVESVENVDVLE